MKVLLIQAPLNKKGGLLSVFPLGLAYLSGALKNHEVTVLDPNACDNPLEEVKKNLSQVNPDVIGLSLRNIDTAISTDSYSFFSSFEALTKLVHENRSDAKIIVGGTGFSIFPREIMQRFSELDYGLFLEGEETFPRLLDNLDRPERVPSIFYRKDGKMHFSGKGALVDFAALDTPPRDLKGLDLDWYRKIPQSIGVQTKRGCAFRCAYCIYPYLQGRNIRLRSPKKVVDEVENLVDNFGVKHVFFADTIFNYPFDHTREICKELKNRKVNVKWGGWFREDFVNKNFLVEAQKAGCICFEFSPDGTSQRSLDVLQKGITIQDIKRTCELIAQVEEAKVNYNFLRNVPGEDLQSVSSFHKLLSWIMAKNLKQIGFIGLNSIRIYPHTAIYQTALDKGYIKAGQDLIKPTFYDPYPLNAAYLPARCANYLYLKMHNQPNFLFNPLKMLRSIMPRKGLF